MGTGFCSSSRTGYFLSQPVHSTTLPSPVMLLDNTEDWEDNRVWCVDRETRRQIHKWTSMHTILRKGIMSCKRHSGGIVSVRCWNVIMCLGGKVLWMHVCVCVCVSSVHYHVVTLYLWLSPLFPLWRLYEVLLLGRSVTSPGLCPDMFACINARHLNTSYFSNFTVQKTKTTGIIGLLYKCGCFSS